MKALALAAALLAAHQAQAGRPQPLSTLVGDTGQVVLPLEIRSGFAFVAGEVNGQAGHFMLDTGTPYTVFLNQAYLHLAPGKETGRGAASSGQKIVVTQTGCLTSLVVAGAFTLDPLCGLPGTDLTFVADQLEPRLLGFLGDGLFSRYRLTLDWRGRRATLDGRSRPVEANPITTFRFKATDGQTPTLTVQAGPVTLAGKMDSGDPGNVILTKADADALIAAGRLASLPQPGGGVRYCLARIEHEGRALDTSDLPVSISGEASSIMLGFQFLAHYRSSWDYADHTVRLYPADPQR